MIEQIIQNIKDIESFTSTSKDEIEKFRIKYLGKKGLVTDLFKEFKNVPNEEKKEFGQLLNQLKSLLV